MSRTSGSTPTCGGSEVGSSGPMANMSSLFAIYLSRIIPLLFRSLQFQEGLLAFRSPATTMGIPRPNSVSRSAIGMNIFGGQQAATRRVGPMPSILMETAATSGLARWRTGIYASLMHLRTKIKTPPPFVRRSVLWVL